MATETINRYQLPARRRSSWSPRVKARIAGVCQLLEALTATFGQVIILNRLLVSGNAPATGASILGHEQLFWLGFSLSLIGVVFHIAWAFLLYELLKPVNRSVSLLAGFTILVGCAVQALTALLYLAPLLILQGGRTFSAFTTGQLQALALIFLKLNGYAFDVYLVFFGLWCIFTGYLIFRSTFLPRVLGVLLTISGLGWVIYLFPPLAIRLFPIIAAASAAGEIPLELWLIVKGVNEKRWTEEAYGSSDAKDTVVDVTMQTGGV